MNRPDRLHGQAAPTPRPRTLTRNQMRYHERLARQADRVGYVWPIILITLAGVAYNCALAFLNAHGFYVGRSLVIVTELLVLAGAALALLLTGFRQQDAPPLLFFATFIFLAVAASLFNGQPIIDMARNAAIISLFLMLGTRLDSAGVRRCFLIAGLLVCAVLLIEIVSTDTYASMFEPGPYFQQTRGIGVSEYDESGLFAPALGFEGRFSLLSITGHRTASLFLEQVSLGNFAAVLSMFLACKWQDIGRWQRTFSIALITLILLTTNSRAGLGLSLAALAAYHIAPKLNRFVPLLVLPLVLIATAVISWAIPSTSDDLPGRLGVTMKTLGELDIPSLLAFRAVDAAGFADSGFTYVITISSIFGLLALWLFASTIAVGDRDDLKRCGLLLSLYIFGNLSVSGTSIFSIKTAALLWLLIGHLRRGEPEKATSKSSAPPVSRPQLRRRTA